MPRSGLAGATTVRPLRCKSSTTPFQPDASAKAPCTSTTTGSAPLRADRWTSGFMRLLLAGTVGPGGSGPGIGRSPVSVSAGATDGSTHRARLWHQSAEIPPEAFGDPFPADSGSATLGGN